jgi:hypothetical protein
MGCAATSPNIVQQALAMNKRVLLLLALLLIVMPASAQDTPISAELTAQMDTLEDYTMQIRGLDELVDVSRDFPTRQELIDYLEELYSRDLAAADLLDAELLYKGLGMLPLETDLREVYLTLLGSQVAGFYDTDTEIMNVIPTIGDDPGESLSLTEQIIYVHEYTHALQDQHFNLDRLQSEELADQPDQSLALLALVEGDATAVMNLYTQAATAQNPFAALGLLIEGVQAGNLFLPEGIPTALVSELAFPYEDGLNFVVNVYEDGGWEAINAAYENPPTTTEQVLHPDKYLAGEGALNVVLGDRGLAPSTKWETIWDTTLGEFYLREHLRAGLSRTQSARAAAGWGGDHFRLYHKRDTGEIGWVMSIQWDSEAEAREFNELYLDYAEERIGSSSRDVVGVDCWSNAQESICWMPDEDEPYTYLSYGTTQDIARALMAMG